jgi:hypothetical protein
MGYSLSGNAGEGLWLQGLAKCADVAYPTKEGFDIE